MCVCVPTIVCVHRNTTGDGDDGDDHRVVGGDESSVGSAITAAIAEAEMEKTVATAEEVVVRSALWEAWSVGVRVRANCVCRQTETRHDHKTTRCT